MDPASRSSSPYWLSLKWNPPSLPNWMSRATIISTLTFGAWWPRSTSEKARAPELSHAVVARAPVVEHSRIERRLVHLVLDEQPPSRRATPGRSSCRLSRYRSSALRKCTWPGKVPAVTNPDRVSPRAELLADRKTFQVVFHRLSSDSRRRCESGCRTCRSSCWPG